MSQAPDKGMFIWRVKNVKGGDPKQIADTLKAANIRRIDVKVCEAQNPYTYLSGVKRIENVTEEWLEAFRDYFTGLIYGWGYCYGHDPKGEGRVAAAQVSRFKLDGYAFNVEGTFERQPSAASRASDMMAEFRKDQRDIPALWCSWPLFKNPYPNGNNAGWHYTDVAVNGMAYCDYGMPMIYWPNTGAYWAKFWLEKSIEQWRQYVTQRAIVPVGRLYTGDGGVCTPDGIEAFGDDVRKRHKLVGESWWRMGTGLTKPDWWTALSRLPAFAIEPPPQPPNTIPVEIWRTKITAWARTQGYDGPWPEPEPVE